MELSKTDWESIKKQSEAMSRDATISLLASDMMLNRAKQELGQIADEEGLLKEDAKL